LPCASYQFIQVQKCNKIIQVKILRVTLGQVVDAHSEVCFEQLEEKYISHRADDFKANLPVTLGQVVDAHSEVCLVQLEEKYISHRAHDFKANLPVTLGQVVDAHSEVRFEQLEEKYISHRVHDFKIINCDKRPKFMW
jgi:hypothetical protein